MGEARAKLANYSFGAGDRARAESFARQAKSPAEKLPHLLALAEYERVFNDRPDKAALLVGGYVLPEPKLKEWEEANREAVKAAEKEWAKEIMHAYDHKNANTSLKNVALVGVKRYWRVYRPQAMGAFRDTESEKVTNGDYCKNRDEPITAIDMDIFEKVPNVGDTWIGIMWIGTEVQATTKLLFPSGASSRVIVDFASDARTVSVN